MDTVDILSADFSKECRSTLSTRFWCLCWFKHKAKLSRREQRVSLGSSALGDHTTSEQNRTRTTAASEWLVLSSPVTQTDQGQTGTIKTGKGQPGLDNCLAIGRKMALWINVGVGVFFFIRQELRAGQTPLNPPMSHVACDCAHVDRM